jgi:hypothetical protein
MKKTLAATLPDGRLTSRSTAHAYAFVLAGQDTTETFDPHVRTILPGWHAVSWHGSRALAQKALNVKLGWEADWAAAGNPTRALKIVPVNA